MSVRREDIVCTYALSYDIHVPVKLKLNSIELADSFENVYQTIGDVENHDLELVATAQLYSEFGALHSFPIHTKCSTLGKGAVPNANENHLATGQPKQRWDQTIEFPCKYSDLHRSAGARIRVYGPGFVEFFHTSISLFDDEGCLKRGRQQVTLELARPAGELEKAAGNRDDCVLPHPVDQPTECRIDEQSRLLKLVEKNREDSRSISLSWLDDALFHRVRANARVAASAASLERSGLSVGAMHNRVHCQGSPTLTVEFPKFDHLVLYESMSYPFGKIGEHLLPNWMNEGSRTKTVCIADPEVVGAQLLHGNNTSHLRTAEELDANPVEAKYYKLARSMLRGRTDPNAKPNKKERQRIQAILDSSAPDMKHDERNLLWQFRYSLVNNRKALIKVVCCVDWRDDAERKEAEELLVAWEAVDLADALRLLCGEAEFRHSALRAYAINVLAKAPNSEIIRYLLQLVQALRYDVPDDSESFGGASSATGNQHSRESPDVGLLANFLISRAVEEEELASYFHWYLRVDSSSDNADPVFARVHKELMTRLENPALETGKEIKASIRLQERFVKRLTEAVQKANSSRENRKRHQLALRRLISSSGEYSDLDTFPQRTPLPLCPSIKAVGVCNDTIRILASNTSPVVLDLEIAPVDQGNEADGVRIDVPEKFRVMFKDGDDLRQDQLVLQLIGLMDKMLKDVNMDLSLTLYRVLATSRECGIMEFVENSYALRKVIHDHKDIRAFFRKHNSSVSGQMSGETDGIPSAVLSRFIKSCAGYCVITYILGIGDRHLDNIMLLPSGQLFHIDFGYIFGRDPKPWPAPMRLTSHMIEAMGGRGSAGYLQFKSHCCQAYKVFRNNVTLIMNLLHLMVDAEIPDLSLNQDQVTVLFKIHDKFHLHLTDEEAEHLLLRLIDQSAVAYGPVIMDFFHDYANSGK